MRSTIMGPMIWISLDMDSEGSMKRPDELSMLE
eukprot:CAMPEP_0198127968 /NCGR_PEP_ID=MMETSP1442-20131203/48332_1 /TAXON_ID= /ORGANISM="Craspedostauros australis, Strain CCMP3328" /LENGTH=32 /DNA_ID= /DNA_START= /DNA_END= /DNA_ORIENTATION=